MKPVQSAVLAATLTATLAATGNTALACERIVPLEAPRVESMMNVLQQQGASAADRMFAFEALACSDKPIVRRFALETAFKSTDRMLRAQALAALLMQREGLRIDLIEDARTDNESRTWIKQHGAALTFAFKGKDYSRNCINLYSAQATCFPDAALVIDGPNVRVSDRTRPPGITADFALQPDNSLRGIVRRQRGQPVNAKVDLLQ